MPNNQTVINQTVNAHPWKDWKVDPAFFVEINNYLESKKSSCVDFVDLMDRIINKTKTGGNLDDLGDILVRHCISLPCSLYSLAYSQTAPHCWEPRSLVLS